MQTADLRDYLAAERTFLAWIRTGLALMGFGFVVSRFGLFLQQLEFVQHQPAARSYGLSLWLGTALIAVGVIVNLSSAWHHARLMRELARRQPPPSRPSNQAIGIAVFLALIGLAMVTYLVSVRNAKDLNSGTGKETFMASTTDNGIINEPGSRSVDQQAAACGSRSRTTEFPAHPDVKALALSHLPLSHAAIPLP